MKVIYFDTEFTGLQNQSKLISIGLVEDTGRKKFYAELKDYYTEEECSDFCKKEVLIHLDKKENQFTFEELQLELTKWLEGFILPVILISDSPKDIEKLQTLFPDGLPKNCTAKVTGLWGNIKRKYLNNGRKLHKEKNLRVHHALDDAEINRCILSKYRK